MPTAITQNIYFQLQKDIPFSIENREHGEQVLQEQNPLDCFLETVSSSHKKKRLSSIADILRCALQQLPRNGELDANEKRDAVQSARLLLKKIEKKAADDPRIQKLEKELLAARLAIPTTVLDQNDGFYAFAYKHYLYRYLLTYGDRLEVDSARQEILIKMNGRMTPWSQV